MVQRLVFCLFVVVSLIYSGSADIPRTECYTGQGAEYNGYEFNTTSTGKSCLPWNSEGLLSSRIAYRAGILYSLILLDGVNNHSFCRNPIQPAYARPYCYTTIGGSFEYCDVPTCAEKIGNDKTDYCYRLTGRGYVGEQSVTSSGKPCAVWDSPWLSGDDANRLEYINETMKLDGTAKHNKCRNPATNRDRPWCYTASSYNSSLKWEYCNVPSCSSACENGACMNGGTCKDDSFGFECDCPIGFLGTRCEIDINECASNPCTKNSECLDLAGRFECVCKKGWNGTRCDQDINECEPKPCLNGTCINKIGRYECDCFPGYEGINCENETNECMPNPCQLGANCTDLLADFRCDCPRGFSGKRCEINIDDCASGPCQNEGMCIDKIEAYECQCKDGTLGDHCETNINECASNPCQNSGTCVDKVGHFKCECPSAYDGLTCEKEKDECEAQPCKNGGFCIDEFDAYTCDCPSGITGFNCETNIDDCPNHDCQNGATCVDGVNAYTCDCAHGYMGAKCELEIKECDSNPCLNGGSCVDLVGKHECICEPGFTGRLCETDINECASNPCQRGTCQDMPGKFVCTCPSGYAGSMCHLNDVCFSAPCLNGATCVDEPNDKFSCECPVGFIGSYCETSLSVEDINECDASPCKNEGTCVDLHGDFKCVCPKEYGGKHCSEVAPYYVWGNWTTCDQPCGICVRTRTEYCVDMNKMLRSDCERSPLTEQDIVDLGTCTVSGIDPCDASPCGSLHQCRVQPTGSTPAFACICAEGYQINELGYCEKIDYCNLPVNNCTMQMDAVTECIAYGSSYACVCNTGYKLKTGSNTMCDDIDECALGTHDCDASPRATCTNTPGSYRCACMDNYSGQGRNGTCKEKRILDCSKHTKVPFEGLSKYHMTELIFAPGAIPVYGGAYRAIYATQSGVAVLVDAKPAEKDTIYRREFRRPSANALSSYKFPSETWPYKALAAVYWNAYGVFTDEEDDRGLYYKTYDKLNKTDSTLFTGSYSSYTWALVVTWKRLQYVGDTSKDITFQMHLLTDFKNTVIRYVYADRNMNWDIPAISTLPNYPVRVGGVFKQATDTYTAAEYVDSWASQSDSAKRYGLRRIDTYVNVTSGDTGVYTLTMSSNKATYTRPEYDCYTWVAAHYNDTIVKTSDAAVCPCTKTQAESDNRWKSFYESIGVFICYDRQDEAESARCCYQSSGDLKGALTTSASGTNVYRRYDTSMSTEIAEDKVAYMSCCVNSDRYCNDFLSIVPVSDSCSGYLSPSGNTVQPPAISPSSVTIQAYKGEQVDSVQFSASSDVTWQILDDTSSTASVSSSGLLTWTVPNTTVASTGKYAFTILACLTSDPTVCSVFTPTIKLCQCSSKALCAWTTEANSKYLDIPCTCSLGVEGRYCETDIDACLDLPCQTQCTDVAASLLTENSATFTCAPCPTGTEGDGVTCTDIDECRKGTHTCNQTCINTQGGYMCACASGFMLSGDNCFDIDECTTNRDNCHPNAMCMNTYGSFTCKCKQGYKDVSAGKGTLCADIDECATNEAKCPMNSICTNTQGSYKCMCKAGFEETFGVNGTQCNLIDQCKSNSGCSHFCVSGVNSFTCSCFDGFTLQADKKTCSLDPTTPPCSDAQSVAKCGDNGQCLLANNINTCVCNAGYMLSDGACVDKDECSTGENLCDLTRSTCVNTAGGYTCQCVTGYWLSSDGVSCLDTDECSTVAMCDSVNGYCQNFDGGYACRCKEGYQLDTDRKTCVDINECQSTLLNNCDRKNGKCTNTDGGFTCSCKPGYFGDGKLCYDLNECEISNGGCTQRCMNSPGSFSCGCFAGYTVSTDSLTCSDVDECTLGSHGCYSSSYCTNTVGSYTCSCPNAMTLKADGKTCTPKASLVCTDNELSQLNGCPNGFCIKEDGVAVCKCSAGYSQSASESCTDIDECTANSNLCPVENNVRCVNVVGSYRCECLSSTQQITPLGTCIDKNECATGEAKCTDSLAYCVNTDPNYRCDCPSGFKATYDPTNPSKTVCTDIDECVIGADKCNNVFGQCVNTKGSYYCECKTGYVGDGFTCYDENECLTGNHICKAGQSVCVNTVGSYNCTCLKGYVSGGNNTCVDEDECFTGANGCSQLCVNTQGSYKCSCRDSYTLQADGITCLPTRSTTSCAPNSTVSCLITAEAECSSSAGCTQLCSKASGTAVCGCANSYWSLDSDGKTCSDIDECSNNPCGGVSPTCTNLVGSGYKCSCSNGYTLSADGKGCYDRDGDWNNWSSWGSCTKTCGKGSMIRARLCNNPSRVGAGSDCVGEYTETQDCNDFRCPTTAVDTQYGTDISWKTDMTIAQFAEVQDKVKARFAAELNAHCSSSSANFQKCCPSSGTRTATYAMTYAEPSGVNIINVYKEDPELRFTLVVVVKKDNALCKSGSVRRKKRETVSIASTETAVSQSVLLNVFSTNATKEMLTDAITSTYSDVSIEWSSVTSTSIVTVPTLYPPSTQRTTKKDSATTTTTISVTGQATTDDLLRAGGEETKSNTAWVIPVAIVCSIIGLAIVIIIVALIVKRPGKVSS